MWPIMLSILNLPFPCRVQPGSILLAGIIPGKSEPKNLDPYIGILVDEINALNGQQLYVTGYRKIRHYEATKFFDFSIVHQSTFSKL